VAFAVPDSKFDVMNETMACETALVHTRSKVLEMFKVDRLSCLQFDQHIDVSNGLKSMRCLVENDFLKLLSSPSRKTCNIMYDFD